MWDMVARYAKAGAALLTALAAAIVAASADGEVSGWADWSAIVIAVIGALSVAGVRNRPSVRVKPSVHDVEP